MKLMTDEELMQRAREAAGLAYAPYSNFFVGAALLSRNGTVYTGCNVENASYGATICAERVAFGKAVSRGEREFSAIAVAAASGVAAYPCGICLQVMSELMPEGRVLLEEDHKLVSYTVRELLPKGFSLAT